MNQKVLEAKQAQVAEIQSIVENSKSFVVAEYRGLSVAEISELRRTLAKSNAKCSVFKNSMVARATSNVEGFQNVLEGPNAFIYADDPIAGPREIAKFAKKHEKLVLKGAIVEGKVVGVDTIKELSSLPNREGMLSMLLSCLQSPVRSFACAVKAVADAKAEGSETPAAETAEAATEAAAE